MQSRTMTRYIPWKYGILFVFLLPIFTVAWFIILPLPYTQVVCHGNCSNAFSLIPDTYTSTRTWRWFGGYHKYIEPKTSPLAYDIDPWNQYEQEATPAGSYVAAALAGAATSAGTIWMLRYLFQNWRLTDR